MLRSPCAQQHDADGTHDSSNAQSPTKASRASILELPDDVELLGRSTVEFESVELSSAGGVKADTFDA